MTESATFTQLADRWETATAHWSSPKRKKEHAAFSAIISLGPQVIPWVIDRLKNTTVHWSLFLSELVSNPPEVDANGDMDKLRAAWLQWDCERGKP